MRNPPPVGKTTYLRDDAVRGFAVRIHPSGRANYYLLFRDGQRKAFWPVDTFKTREGWLLEPGDLLKKQLPLAREYAARELHPYRAFLSNEYEPKAPKSVSTPNVSPGKFAIDRVFAEFTKWYLKEKKKADSHYIHDCETRFKRMCAPSGRARIFGTSPSQMLLRWAGQ
jgi:hypothetical protein